MMKQIIKPLAIGVGLLAVTAGIFVLGADNQSAQAATRSAAQIVQAASAPARPQIAETEAFIVNADDDFAESFGFAGVFDEMFIDDAQAADEPGIVIVRVDKDSPAAKVGVKRGDIVLKIGETDIKTPRDAAGIVGKLKIGDKLKLTLTHGDETKNLEVTVGDKNGRPYLGIAPLGVGNVRIVRGAALPFGGKIKVTQVITNGPAAKAGLRNGDVIIEIDGKKLDTPLPAMIAAHKPGDVIKVKVERGNETSELTVTLGENPNKKGVAYLGVMFTPSLPALPPGVPGAPNGPRGPGGNSPRGPFPLPGGPTGPGAPISGTQIIVASVSPSSPADKAGIKVGNIIEAIDGVKMTDPKSVTDAITKHKPGDVVKISIRKPGDTAATDLTVTLVARPNDDSPNTAFLGVSLNFTRNIHQTRDPQG